MTTTADRPPQPDSLLTTVPPSAQTADDVAIGRIVAETKCPEEVAEKLLARLRGYVEIIRATGKAHIPAPAEMRDDVYRVMDWIMPHDGRSGPGTAHAAVEAALLDPSKGELGLLHFDAVYCMVGLETETVPVP